MGVSGLRGVKRKEWFLHTLNQRNRESWPPSSYTVTLSIGHKVLLHASFPYDKICRQRLCEVFRRDSYHLCQWAPFVQCYFLSHVTPRNKACSLISHSSVWAEAESEEESSFLPSPAELRDGTIPAPDLPEGADCANGVVADARSGYVARLVGAQRLSV